MTRASCAKALRLAAVVALAALVALGAFPRGGSAAIETDPQALYDTMKKAYDTGLAHGWTFSDEQYYLSTVLDAGRSYSLFRPSDPNYAELATLTVDVTTQLHYDPLTSDDAAEWYVREAVDYVIAHGDAARVAAASALLAKVQASADPKQSARIAVDDGAANAQAFPGDADAGVQAIVANIRAYNLTHDPVYRSGALERAAKIGTPVGRLPDVELAELVGMIDAAPGNDPSFTDADRANARVIEDRRKTIPDLLVIGRVHSLDHGVRMTRTAPADEYFGRQKMSPLGIRNELSHIEKWLDAGWGAHMTHETLEVVNAIDDWQRQYPHDLTLPQHLLDVYHLLARIDDEAARGAADHVKSVLLIEYASSSQARALSTS
jgi:hypothetical protein